MNLIKGQFLRSVAGAELWD